MTTAIFIFSKLKTNVFPYSWWDPAFLQRCWGYPRGSEHDHSLLTPFAPCHTVTYAGICTHQSWLLSHPSLDGRGRDPSDRLILNCFHSLGWHPVPGVIYTVAQWKLVYNAMWSKMILLASWSVHPSINTLRVILLATKSAPGRCLCYKASLSCSHIFFKLLN